MAGVCHGRFEAVGEAFEENFAQRGELGAAVSVTIDGETAVDLWAGHADEQHTAPWEQDTLSVVWSVSKTISATCAHVLASNGEIDLFEPVAKYWPEYASSPAKQTTTVFDTLAHLAAQPCIQGEIPDGMLYDWDWITDKLATQEPLWEPGVKSCYHAFTFGFHAGEIIRRVTGLTLGQYLQREIAGRLQLDMWLGLPEELEPRVAPQILDMAMMMPDSDDIAENPLLDPESLQFKIFSNLAYHYGPDGFNSRGAHAAELPAVGAITNARSLASLYRPLCLDGSFDGVRVVDPHELSRMSYTVSGNSRDPFLGFGMRYSLGYWRSMDNRRQFGDLNSFIVGRSAFGHVGAGGHFVFADPDERLSMGYTMNLMGPGGGLNTRGQALIDAAYKSLGYATNDPGFWVK